MTQCFYAGHQQQPLIDCQLSLAGSSIYRNFEMEQRMKGLGQSPQWVAGGGALWWTVGGKAIPSENRQLLESEHI